MTLVQVISGGQTGVDIAALRAAKAVGLRTGGWMPRGYRTLNGPKPIYADQFGLTEHSSSAYPPRTHANVHDADATLRLAVDFDSAGERCTHQGIVKYRKPHCDVVFAEQFTNLRELVADMPRVLTFLRERKVVVLNVAGNSEFTAPGIESNAEWYLTLLFRAMKFREGYKP